MFEFVIFHVFRCDGGEVPSCDAIIGTCISFNCSFTLWNTSCCSNHLMLSLLFSLSTMFRMDSIARTKRYRHSNTRHLLLILSVTLLVSNSLTTRRVFKPQRTDVKLDLRIFPITDSRRQRCILRFQGFIVLL
jgi:hypothetical protein